MASMANVVAAISGEELRDRLVPPDRGPPCTLSDANSRQIRRQTSRRRAVGGSVRRPVFRVVERERSPLPSARRMFSSGPSRS